MRREVQFRSRAASPAVFAIGLPLAESVLTAGGVAVLVGLLRLWRSGTVLGALRAGGTAFIVLASVLVALRFGRAVLWGIEGLAGRDLDGDGHAGKPQEPRFVFVKRAGRRNSHDDDFRDFVRGCYVRGTGRRAWANARLPTTNHKLSKGMWQRFTGIMLKSGVLEDLGTGNGTELTVELDEALEALGLDR